MNIALWIVQGLLALLFVMSGGMKAVRPLADLKKTMHWISDDFPLLPRLIGIAEVLGALGLILPGVTHILPWLTVVAAAGLAITMLGACIVHARQKEYNVIGVTLILLILAAFVVIGRLGFAPLS